MKKNQIIKYLSAISIIVLSGCTNETIEEVTLGGQESSNSIDDDPFGEIIEYSDITENAKFFSEELVEITPTNTFRDVEIILSTSTDLDVIQYQVQAEDGIWTEWEQVSYEGIEENFYSIHLDINTDNVYSNLKIKNLRDVNYAKFLFTGIKGEHTTTSNSTSRSSKAISGRWNPPTSVRAIGDNQSVPFTQDSGSCSGGLLDGTNILRKAIREQFPQVFLAGGYCCRAIGGSSCLSGRPTPSGTPSQHSYGRAVDLHISTTGGQADNDAGDPVAHWLIENADNIGIQFIIWDQSTWRADRAIGAKIQNYGGANPHVDHLHIELSREGARGETPWFTGGGTSPDQPVGPLSNRSDFITQLYMDALGRVPNNDELQEWINRLADNSFSNYDVITVIVNSTEAKNRLGITSDSPADQIRRIFKTLLKRTIEESAIPGIISATNNGESNRVSALVFDSVEYKNRFGKYRPFNSSTAFVQAQFKNVLKREAGEASNTFVTQLNAGETVVKVLSDIINSPESRNIHGDDQVIRAHRALLQRDPIGINHIHWNRIFDEQGLTGLINGLYNSPEYRLLFDQ